MILTFGAMFLYNLLCGLVPCDPKYQAPEMLSVPAEKSVQLRNIVRRNIPPVVKTRDGVVEGYLMKSTMGKEFYAFEGIPYGESTAGSRRWKPPVPKRPWRGVRQAKKPGPECTQLSLQKLLRVIGNDNCLYINLYTSSLPPTLGSEKLPVIVFIHGGSFIFGSGSEYGPGYIMNEDNVIYVNFNYRLGPLGFLSTGDEAIPGNYGLKDQALALKWVHDNIELFGGDKHRCTIMGNSAGSVSVSLHLISHSTRNYFSNAFSSSGTAFQYWAVQSKERMRELTYKLAKRFRCQHEDSFKMARCLEGVDSNILTAAQLQLFDWFPLPPVLFSPTVEPDHPDAFLIISPEEAYKTGAVAKKPYVVGMTKEEGKTIMIILRPMAKTLPLRVMWDQIAPLFLQYHNQASNPTEVTRKIEDFYFKGKTARQASLDDFSDMVTDRYLALGIIKGIQAHFTTGAPTYMYHFSFSDANHNLANTIGYSAKDWGASHTEDMFYFFNNSGIYDGQKFSDPDRELSKIMINVLSNFARTGQPVYTSDTNEDVKIWEPITNPSQIRALQFDKTVEMTSLSDNQIERLKFWSDLNLLNTSLLFPLDESHSEQTTLKIDENII